jgi:DnaJ-class molecular chaperone
MASKDYYGLLGIPRTASTAEVREAFWELAKQYHPDRVGSEGTAYFQDLVQAYVVLSDAEKRRQYNRTLHRTEPVQPARARQAWHAQPEPLITDITPVGDFGRGYAAFAEPLAPFWGHYSHQRFQAREPRGRLHVEVTLSRDEAVSGGRLPLQVPAVSVCPTCHGAGHDWYFLCASCRGSGTLTTQQTMQIHIPPQIRDGSLLEIPLAPYGLPYILHVSIRVNPWSA